MSKLVRIYDFYFQKSKKKAITNLKREIKRTLKELKIPTVEVKYFD